MSGKVNLFVRVYIKLIGKLKNNLDVSNCNDLMIGEYG